MTWLYDRFYYLLRHRAKHGRRARTCNAEMRHAEWEAMCHRKARATSERGES